ncbi:MAG: type 1 glutamine amidotransferase domain-containing protein [Acidobacteriota bacterium]
MARELENYRVAIVVDNGFEEEELAAPKRALEAAGARADIVSPVKGKVRGWRHDHWGHEWPVDRNIATANPADYDALLLPGGVMNPDKLRRNESVLNFVRPFVRSGKPIAAICHGAWTLIDADGVRGRRMTSWPSLQTDLTNAGAKWVDQEVVVDQGLVTSRSPADLPAFNTRILEEFAESRHATPGTTRARR